ncbi:nucleoplasmin-like protein ANO39 [Dioscorea cayenensis subsp. rotundata]|uniref:Nucleoplasmin-like protein ANO39 n=1 Tax=Dioscorea cayennensis subsp. rotundata TaxID=55577 RepID=A0AB40BMJ4_DIOCR|nr:nucleoplasmin-like protein ANO39 [Dioscorea cayenensis subsp. rotundata]XP_039128630.1 nucleoplasmin-like protein ANO39 [Dioscorea cayenensis subsp. rotundata]XP_039128632.1 nucleoplasmin-like protein ANO39 [Dioscorea cayenensis subsp. rotundata]
MQENVSLPDLPNAEAFTNEERVLITGKIKLEYFWKASCYHLEEGSLKSSKIGHNERKLEIFEKLEERSKGHNEKDAHASKRKGESDDEGLAEGEAEEESSEDDYNQNVDFDDDEDDLNMEEEADEDFYE